MRHKHPYHLKREQEEAARTAAGLISERFARIAGIEFRMTYYHRAVNPVLMERTLSFSPDSYARFHVRCAQQGCTDGGYDLGPVVADLARRRKTSAKGTLFCHGSNGETGHGSIVYEVTVRYRRGA